MAQRKKELSEFGEYVVYWIDKTKMTKGSFYEAIGIQKPYFYEILVGNAPSQEILERMIAVFDEKLGQNVNRNHKLYDLAAASRGEIPADIMELLLAAPERWDMLRSTLKNSK